MKCQIQVRGEWAGTAGDWRPLRVAAEDLPLFASWDEAEEALEQLQQAGLVPLWPEAHAAELRIIDLVAERLHRRRPPSDPPRSAEQASA